MNSLKKVKIHKNISSASNILHWSFCSVIEKDGKSVKSVVCRNMWLGIIKLNSICIKRLIVDQAWIYSNEMFKINSLE